MSKTREWVCFYLPNAINELVMEYVESPHRTWFDMAREGEFESCTHCPLEFIEKVLLGACEGRYKQLAQWAIDHRAQDMDTALLYAIHCGNLEMVQWTIEKGAKNFDAAVETCIQLDQHQLLTCLLTFPLESLEQHLVSAGLNGKYECLKILMAHKPPEMEAPGCASVCGGNLDCVKLCVDHGATNFGYMFGIACCNKTQDIIEYLRDKVKKCKVCNLSTHEHFQ